MSGLGTTERELTIPRTRAEQRGLAEAMRRLPRHYATRLSAHALEKITTAAAAGQWEKAIDQLIISLHARAAIITTGEREELRAVLEVLNMPTDCLDTLLPGDHQAKGGPATAPSSRPQDGEQVTGPAIASTS